MVSNQVSLQRHLSNKLLIIIVMCNKGKQSTIALGCSMKWVELKMGKLGVLSNPQYKVTALMDHLAMITVQSESQSRKKTFECKPLGVIWAQFPEVTSLCLLFYH
jgi:hypothetical protein